MTFPDSVPLALPPREIPEGKIRGVFIPAKCLAWRGWSGGRVNLTPTPKNPSPGLRALSMQHPGPISALADKGLGLETAAGGGRAPGPRLQAQRGPYLPGGRVAGMAQSLGPQDRGAVLTCRDTHMGAK